MLGNGLETAPPERLAVVRALRGLGDFLCAVPAWRALRKALPDARITYIGLESARPLQERFSHYLDDFLEFPGFPGIPERPAEPARLLEFLDSSQGRFDMALQMQGSGVHSNPFTVLLGAKRSAGFYLPSLWCPDPQTFTRYPGHLNEIRRWLALVEFLGLPPNGEELEFPVTQEDERDLSAAWPLQRPGNYVCLHPGAFEPERRWPVERFAEVGDALAETGRTVVLTGNEQEANLTARVRHAMRNQAVDLAGRTGLGALAVLLRGANLLVCNDTGVSHLAAAVGAPSVVVFAASDPDRWAPLDRARHRIVGRVQPERANACRHSPDIKGHRCLRDACSSLVVAPADEWEPASVEEVLEQARELLADSRAH